MMSLAPQAVKERDTKVKQDPREISKRTVWEKKGSHPHGEEELQQQHPINGQRDLPPEQSAVASNPEEVQESSKRAYLSWAVGLLFLTAVAAFSSLLSFGVVQLLFAGTAVLLAIGTFALFVLSATHTPSSK